MSDESVLVQRLRKMLQLDPARKAVDFGNRTYTWEQVSACMSQLDKLLRVHGLNQGAAIGMALKNRPAHFAALMEVITSERCVVTINSNVTPDKLVGDLDKLDIPVLVADAETWEVEGLKSKALEKGVMGIALSAGENLDVELVSGLEQPRAGAGSSLPGIVIQMLTSGTTGPSKRIDLKFESFQQGIVSAQAYESGSADAPPVLKDSTVIVLQPFVHIAGIWSAVSAVFSGRSICLFEKFEIEPWHQAVLKYRPKLCAMPPTVIRMIVDAKIPREDLSSILAFRSGTAPLDPKLQEEVEHVYGIPILDSYGATEFAGGVAGWTLKDYQEFGKAKRGSVGVAQPGCQLRIVDVETFAPLPAGKVGLLEVKAKHVGDGEWTRTTDLGEIDEDGFLFIRGRADDAIIRGGFKILPREVVDLLKEHPAVKDASVVGLPDARLGQVPVAAVELKPGEVAEPSEIMAYARNGLTRYQVPVELKIVAELPRTPSLKVSQPEVRKLFVEIEGAA